MTQPVTVPEFTVVDSEKISQQWDLSKILHRDFNQVKADLVGLSKEVQYCITSLENIRISLVVLEQSLSEQD